MGESWKTLKRNTCDDLGKAEVNNLQETKIEKVFKAKNISRGVFYFVFLSIVGLTILFFLTKTPQSVKSLLHLDTRFLIIALLLSLLDIWLGAWRYHILLKRINPQIKPWLSLKTNLADTFMSAITPFQTGGAPAILYVLHRGGISIPIGLSISIMIFIMTLVFLFSASVFSLFIVRIHSSHTIINYLVKYGFIAFASTLVFFIFSVWRPDLLGRGFNKIAKIIAKALRKWNERINRINKTITSELEKYHTTCKHFLKKEPLFLFLVFLVTIFLFLNKATLAYFLVRGLGINISYLNMIAIQTLILFIPYFAPSPGGSGIAELSIAGLMSGLIPSSLLLIFTLLHRFFLLYLQVVFGALVVLIEVKSHSLQLKPQSKET